jgi:vancomycin resistance protein VanJ
MTRPSTPISSRWSNRPTRNCRVIRKPLSDEKRTPYSKRGKKGTDASERVPERDVSVPFLAGKWTAAALAALFGLWVVGQIVRDRTWFTGLCFYFPSPLCAALLILGAGWLLWRSRRRLGLIMALLAVTPLLTALFAENHWDARQQNASSQDLRLVHWNVLYHRMGWQRIHSRMGEENADFYLLSEVWPSADIDVMAKMLGDDYTALWLGNMAVMARGELELVERSHVNGARPYLVRWRHNGKTLLVLAVDVHANVFGKRVPVMQGLCALIQEHQPDIVAGDFNTPRLSVGLRDLPEGYRHAYDAAGSGWSYTWPVPAPMLAIDQCIAGPRVDPVRYAIHATTLSDHCMQVFDFN